ENVASTHRVMSTRRRVPITRSVMATSFSASGLAELPCRIYSSSTAPEALRSPGCSHLCEGGHLMDRRELMALLGFGGGFVLGGTEVEAADHEKKEPGQR